ncbi:hypothetical protein H0178_49845 [Cytobacillus firmus]|nr:hypothetical protein [Cytobacillus firmus]
MATKVVCETFADSVKVLIPTAYFWVDAFIADFRDKGFLFYTPFEA